MKFTEMLAAEPDVLRTHYHSVRSLAANNARMAGSTRPNSRSRGKLANQMGFLMRQVEMCEAAADRRRLSLA